MRTSELFPSTVAVAELAPGATRYGLFPEEERYVRRAVARRRDEFAAGRACARAALSSLGAERVAIPVGPDRSPQWPPGIVGSITHTGGYCAVAVARTTSFSGIGIDAEEIGAVSRDLWPVLFTPAEIRLLESLPRKEQLEMATVLFSAKESFYKCGSARSAGCAEFTDVEISVSGSTFTVHPIPPAASARSAQLSTGKYLIERNRVLTGIAIARA